MRLTELRIENYGGYAARSLAIPESAGLAVIYGPNEAGKSTCLEAISDFLFSVPPNTARGSLYGYDGMRISASMRMADDRLISLRRRKGKGKTLADTEGTVFDDTVLAPVLGAITRDRFGTLQPVACIADRFGDLAIRSSRADPREQRRYPLGACRYLPERRDGFVVGRVVGSHGKRQQCRVPFIEVAQSTLAEPRCVEPVTARHDEPLARQPVQHVAHRRHADTELVRKPVGLEPGTWWEQPVTQHLPERYITALHRLDRAHPPASTVRLRRCAATASR
jgi:hypothetical protein